MLHTQFAFEIRIKQNEIILYRTGFISKTKKYTPP